MRDRLLHGSLTGASQPAAAGRAAAALAVALAIVLATCAPAWAGGQVTVAPAGGQQATLSISGLESGWDVRERTYTVRGADGHDRSVTVSGISIDRLLDRAGVDPFGYRGLEVAGGGRRVSLGRDQVTNVEAFPDGRPVFYLDGGGAHFLLPSGGGGEVDGGDVIDVADGDFTVSLSKASHLEVKASASRLRVKKGQAVTFVAHVTGTDAGAARVRWQFDGDGSVGGRRATHRFTRPGTYDVVVGATTAADPRGADDVVTVQVGKPRVGGPDRKGGGTSTDASAPDSGAATGPTSTSAETSEAARSAPPRTPGAQRGARARDQRTPRRERRGSIGSSAGSATHEQVSTATGLGPSEPVRGTLLSEASVLPTPATADAVRAARTGNLRPPDDPGGPIPPAVWGLLGALALLGLGGWRERRGLRRRSSA